MVLAPTAKGVSDVVAQLQQELQRAAGIFIENRGGRVIGKNEVIITIESGGQDRACMGTFAANTWANVDLESRDLQLKREAYKVLNKDTGEEAVKYRQVGTIHEISIKAEHLTGTVYEILGTLGHELVHLENHDHCVKDCSKGGSHNPEFKKTAEEWGFEVTHGKDCGKPSKGWAFTEPGPDFIAFVDEHVKPRTELYNVARLPKAKNVSSPSSMATLHCQCDGTEGYPKSVTMSRGAVVTKLAGKGLPICPECEARYVQVK
jgi:hypothetical protein